MLFVKRIRFLKIEFDVFLMRFWLFLKLLKELVIVFFFMIVFNEVFKELDKYGVFFLFLKKGGGLWNMMKLILFYDFKF